MSHVAIIRCVFELTTPLGLPDFLAGVALSSMFSIKLLIVVRGDHQRVGNSSFGDLPKTSVIRQYGTVQIRKYETVRTRHGEIKEHAPLRCQHRMYDVTLRSDS